MVCDRCGKDAFPLHSMPTKVSEVTHKIKHVQWVCDQCLTPREKFLIAIRDYKPKPRVISLEEFQEIRQKAEFECPLGLIPEECDGHICPSKITMGARYENPYDDYYYECLEALQARIVLKKLLTGEAKVNGFSVRPEG